jgi:putative transposase
MVRRAREKSRSGIYHVMWRGANRQEIFHDDEDCRKFLDITRRYKLQSEMKIYAWCLMNNHVHFLVKEGSEALSATMKRIGVSYVWYYNQKYGTTGHLFQDRFKSESVESRKSIFSAARYIHQNPVKAGMVSAMDEWKWSSSLSYFGNQNTQEEPKGLLDQDYILQLLSEDADIAREKFRIFNEELNQDQFLEDTPVKRRLTDEEAKVGIKALLGTIEIPQVKSLPKAERDLLIGKMKKIKGLSQRQAARILGISANIISKA